MKFTVEGLLEFHSWTHEVLRLVLNHAGSLPPQKLTEAVPGFGHDTIAKQLTHVLFTEEAWLRAAQCLEYRRWDRTFETLDEIAVVRDQVMAGTMAYIESLDDATVNELIPKLPEYWNGPPRSPAFICHHVLTHAFHHKGQMAALFRFLGHPLPDTDMQRQE